MNSGHHTVGTIHQKWNCPVVNLYEFLIGGALQQPPQSQEYRPLSFRALNLDDVGDAIDDDNLPRAILGHLKKSALDIQVNPKMLFKSFEQGCDVLAAYRLAFTNPPILDHGWAERRAVLQSSLSFSPSLPNSADS